MDVKPVGSRFAGGKEGILDPRWPCRNATWDFSLNDREPTMTGTIKTLVVDKGYGFIRADGKGPDVFFHLSVLQDARFEEIEIDMKVRYEQGVGRNGKPRAEKIWIDP
jgi:CspA family cold shock protein